MAERRMFAKTIIDSDAFLDMPLSAQALYFHLSMRADDEGFVGNPKRIRCMVGASEDDLKLLILKRFLLVFESGVVVIKHWKIHNYIQSDRCKSTTYLEERETLALDRKKAYIEKVDTDCIQNGYSLDTQYRLDKDSIEKISIDKDSIGKEIESSVSDDTSHRRFVKPTIEEVRAYCKERNNGVDAQRFVDYYESKGWKVGRTPMKDWRACVRTWENRERNNGCHVNNNTEKTKYPIGSVSKLCL